MVVKESCFLVSLSFYLVSEPASFHLLDVLCQREGGRILLDRHMGDVLK